MQDKATQTESDEDTEESTNHTTYKSITQPRIEDQETGKGKGMIFRLLALQNVNQDVDSEDNKEQAGYRLTADLPAGRALFFFPTARQETTADEPQMTDDESKPSPQSQVTTVEES